MTLRRLSVVNAALVLVAFAVPRAGAQTGSGPAQHAQPYRQYEGPPVSLTDLLREAAEKNPDLDVLRRQIDVMRQRPLQERALMPPMAEAQIWQWPLNTL